MVGCNCYDLVVCCVICVVKLIVVLNGCLLIALFDCFFGFLAVWFWFWFDYGCGLLWLC